MGMSWEKLARIADAHTLLVQRWLSSRSPNGAALDGSGAIVGATGLPIPLLNQALGADYPPGTPPAQIHAEIDEIAAFFAARNVPWNWWLGPFTRPADMLPRLKQHGLTYDGDGLPVMAAALPPVTTSAIPPDIQVWQAATLSDLQAASYIRRIAFRFPQGAAPNYFEAMSDDWTASPDKVRLYLARTDDGPPAAIGALIMAAGVPGVYVMATLPEWGRRGLGHAILARILADASTEGHRLIVLTASRYGIGLYRKFGFEQIFDYVICSKT